MWTSYYPAIRRIFESPSPNADWKNTILDRIPSCFCINFVLDGNESCSYTYIDQSHCFLGGVFSQHGEKPFTEEVRPVLSEGSSLETLYVYPTHKPSWEEAKKIYPMNGQSHSSPTMQRKVLQHENNGIPTIWGLGAPSPRICFHSKSAT